MKLVSARLLLLARIEQHRHVCPLCVGSGECWIAQMLRSDLLAALDPEGDSDED